MTNRISFWGKGEDGASPRMVLNELGIVPVLLYPDILLDLLRLAFERKADGAPPKLLFLRPEPLVIKFVASAAKVQARLREQKPVPCVAVSVVPTPSAYRFSEDLSWGQSLSVSVLQCLEHCKQTAEDPPMEFYPLDRYHGQFDYVYLSLNGLKSTGDCIRYWLNHVVREYMAPGGTVLVYYPLGQPVSVYENDLPPDWAEFSDALGYNSFVRSTEMRPQEVLKVLGDCNLSLTGHKWDNTLGRRKEQIENACRSLQSVLSPYVIDKAVAREWLKRQSFATHALILEKKS